MIRVAAGDYVDLEMEKSLYVVEAIGADGVVQILGDILG